MNPLNYIPFRGAHCYIEKVPGRSDFLKICPWQAKEWFLPWSRMESFCFSLQGELDTLEIYFPFHHVVVVGEALKKAESLVVGHEPIVLRTLPDEYRALIPPGEPVIHRLEVRVSADLAQLGSDGIPF